jgi:ligand-binding sensor domain-containing protein
MKLAILLSTFVCSVAYGGEIRALVAPTPVVQLDADVVAGTPLRVTAVPSLSAPHRILVVDDEIWLASDAGIARLALRGASTARMIVSENGAPLGPVSDLARVGQDVWAATSRGVLRIDARTRRARTVGAPTRRVTAFAPPRWAVTDRGVERIDDGHVDRADQDVTAIVRCGEVDHFVAHGALLDEHPLRGAGTVTALACTRGTLLLGTDAGLYRLDEHGARRLGPSVLVTGLAVDDATGAIAIGTLADGAWLIRRDGTSAPLGATHGRVWALAPAPFGWIISIDDELVRVRHQRVTQRWSTSGPRGLSTAIAGDGDSAWVGTFDDGLYYLSGASYARVPLPEARITALSRDGDVLYVGTAAGLFQIAIHGPQPIVSGPLFSLRRHVSMLRPSPEGLWVGMYPGGMLLDRSAAIVKRYSGVREEEPSATPIFGTTLFGLLEQGGAVWLATQDGVERVTPDGTEVLATVGGSAPDDWINDVSSCDDQVVFLTADRGLGWLGPSGTTLARAHLPSSTGSLRAIGDSVVFAADHGLVAARCADRGRRLVRYDAQAGIGIIPTTLSYDGERDRLWVGGVGGAIVIDRARAQIDHATPPPAEAAR